MVMVDTKGVDFNCRTVSPPIVGSTRWMACGSHILRRMVKRDMPIDLADSKLLDHPALLAVVADLGLETVPQLGNLVLNHTIDELVAFSEGTSVLNPKTQREGVILRPLVEEYDEEIGGRLSFKAINPKFLSKYDE